LNILNIFGFYKARSNFNQRQDIYDEKAVWDHKLSLYIQNILTSKLRIVFVRVRSTLTALYVDETGTNIIAAI
jgi:hypothetical protein